jgi:hypothetical protein
MGRKNRNGRSRNAGMKDRAKRFAGEFVPTEILRDLREDFAPADKYSADDGWDDDLNIEVIEVRPRVDQNRESDLPGSGSMEIGNTSVNADGVPVEETIRNHTDIFDFCMRLKTNSKSTPYFRHFDSDYNVVNDKLDRTTRYYISNKGGNLYKDFNGKQVGVNIGFSVTLFNKYVKKDMKDYDINYRFYIIEAKKLITSIETKQLSLFDLF